MEDKNKQAEFVYPKLDYSITDPQERNKIVHEICDTIPRNKLTPYYLGELTKYLLITPENKKTREILTDNRMATVNKRETSFEGIVSKLENGEDGIYNYMTGGDRNILLTLKPEITQNDIEEIPELKELIEEIKKVEEAQKKARGRKKYLLVKQLIEMRQSQYILKNSFKPTIGIFKAVKNTGRIGLYEANTIDDKGEPANTGVISFFDPKHIGALLVNYSSLKEQAWGNFDDDLYYLMEDLDNLIESVLKDDHPVLYDILIDKIDKVPNKEIAERIMDKYGFTYSVEYISALWRKKTPKILAEAAKKDWLLWHYTYEEKGKWKRCSRCGEIKLAHPYFFTRNNTSKDGFYSLCKECRNKKK